MSWRTIINISIYLLKYYNFLNNIIFIYHIYYIIEIEYIIERNIIIYGMLYFQKKEERRKKGKGREETRKER